MTDKELYNDFIDQNQDNLVEAMKDEIRHLFVEFSAIGGDVDEINKAAEEYSEVIMKLIWETRYEW